MVPTFWKVKLDRVYSQVSMYHSLGVQVVKADNQLRNYQFGCFFRQSPFPFDQLSKGAAIAILSDGVQVLGSLDQLYSFENVGALHAL